MRARWMALLGFGLGMATGACGGGGEENPFAGDSSCPEGTEGCPCYDDECLGALVCASNTCVMLPGETGGDGDADGTDDSAGDGDGSAGDGDGSAGDGDGSAGDGDGSAGDGDGSAGDGDGSAGDGDGSAGDGDGTAGDGDGDGALPLGELERCASDMECDTGLVCRQMTRGGLSRCTSTCVSNAQCPMHTRCIDDGTGTKRCLGEDIGRSCTQANDCMSACLQNQGYCTDFCSAGGDCPNGYGCMPVGTPSQNVCVKVEALCDAVNTAECIAPSACDLGPNMILGGCTSTCNTAADCPQRADGLLPWTCDGLCRRPADVFGPLEGGWSPTEWHCDAWSNPVVLCNDAQHVDFSNFVVPAPPAVDCQSSLTTTGSANDTCANSCLNRGGCTYDFSCTAIGSIGGNRIGLCLPSGATETGQNCSSNTQCEFGYCFNGVCSRDCTFDDVCTNGTSCSLAGSPAVEGMPFKVCQ